MRSNYIIQLVKKLFLFFKSHQFWSQKNFIDFNTCVNCKPCFSQYELNKKKCLSYDNRICFYIQTWKLHLKCTKSIIFCSVRVPVALAFEQDLVDYLLKSLYYILLTMALCQTKFIVGPHICQGYISRIPIDALNWILPNSIHSSFYSLCIL